MPAMGDDDFLECRGPITLGCLYSSECILANLWKPGELVFSLLYLSSETEPFLGSFSFLFVPFTEAKIPANLAPGSACQQCIV